MPSPPVTVVGQNPAPAGASGVVVNIPGGANATTSGTVNKPTGGAPSYESGAGATAVLSSISPATAVVGGANLTMTATGTGFDANSVIRFNNGIETTTYVSPTSMTTVVKPSLASGASTVPVDVQQGAFITPSKTFTFTAT